MQYILTPPNITECLCIIGGVAHCYHSKNEALRSTINRRFCLSAKDSKSDTKSGKKNANITRQSVLVTCTRK